MITCCIVEGKENEVTTGARLSMAMEFSYFAYILILGKRCCGGCGADIV